MIQQTPNLFKGHMANESIYKGGRGKVFKRDENVYLYYLCLVSRKAKNRFLYGAHGYRHSHISGGVSRQDHDTM